MNTKKVIHIILYLSITIGLMSGCGGAKGKNGEHEVIQETSHDNNAKTTNEGNNIKQAENSAESSNLQKGNDKINGDHPLQKIVQYGTDNAMFFPAKLRFIDGSSIDVRDINPYKDLSYKMYRKDLDGFEYFYDLTEMSRAEQDEILRGCRINPDALRNSSYLRIFAKPPVVELSDSLVAIAYHIAYYSNEEDILGTQGIAILYDNTGNEIKRIEDKKDGFYDIRLSKDGKYLMQKYGIDYGEDGGGQLDRGFRFYDTHTGGVIFEWELGKDQFLQGYDMFFDTHYAKFFRVEQKNFEQYLIDYINREVYAKFMDRWKYINDPVYSETLFPNFRETKNIKDLIKDDFKKIK